MQQRTIKNSDAALIIMNFKRKSAYVKLPDPNMDCPNRNCSGWLILYGVPTEPKPTPVYFQCSNRAHPDEAFRCKQRVIFSHHPGMCSICDVPILLKDIITTGWDQKWVHLRCAHRSVQPAEIFAVCLRCSGNIADAADAEPGNVGGMDGFLHLGCTKKRRMQLAASDTDGDIVSSQESF